MNTAHLKKLLLLTFFGIVVGFSPLTKVIAADLAAPQIAIAEVSNKLKQKLQNESFVKDFSQVNVFVKQVIEPHVDFNRISTYVLGKLGRKAKKQDKDRFKKEFKTLLIRTYSRAFVEFKDWDVRFLPLKIKQGAKKIIVKTQILQPGIQPLSVNYRMVFAKGKWKVYDFMIEGVSLVINYRTSINNEFKKTGSLSAVIDKLAKRNALVADTKD